MHSPSQPRFAEPRLHSLIPSLHSSPLSFLTTSSALSSSLFIAELLSSPISLKPAPHLCHLSPVQMSLSSQPLSVHFCWTVPPWHIFGPFCFGFLSLKSKPMKIMSPKWSEHFEFNMCENIWIQRREHSAVLSFPGKCCCSRWDQTSTPPHLSAHPAPSVPLVSHEHRNDF